MLPQNKKFADIIKPQSAPLQKGVVAPRAPEYVRRRPRALAIVVCSLAVLLIPIAAYLTVVAQLKTAFLAAKDDITNNMRDAADALKNFDIGGASASIANITEGLANVKTMADNVGLFQMFALGGKLFPALQNVPDAFNDFMTFSGSALGLSEELDALQKNAFRMMFSGEGAELIKRLDTLNAKLADTLTLANRLQTSAAAVRVQFPGDYLALMVNLYRNQTLLKGLSDFLGGSGPTHLALLFQNPSEMRPTGGFIGSYAVVTVDGGNVTTIDVRDIYDPDGQLDIAVLPPLPLQAVTGKWGARDANWFFDFPTSAAKVLSFLEKSKIYSERGVTFAGAVAINVRLLEDLLRVTGPIELPEYQKTLTHENVLAEIQEEVEAGDDKRAGTPKRILGVLTPVLLQKLADATSEQKQSLAEALKNRIGKKDLMAYAADRALEAYIQNSGFGGELYAEDTRATEDYLAVVNANIAGGKSDAFVNESITLESAVDLEGKIRNRLAVTRAHTGDTRDDWWYRAPNKNYIQLFVPRESRLQMLSGHDGKIPDAPLVRPSYLRDADVLAVENSGAWLPEFKAQQYAQFGKTTFGTWFTVKRGEKKTLIAEYNLTRRLILADGIGYRFVFERQSGTNTRFSYKIEAPPGFVWKENGATTYAYETAAPDARIVLDLTLAKLAL